MMRYGDRLAHPTIGRLLSREQRMKTDETDQQSVSAIGFAVSQRIADPFHPLKKSVANTPKFPIRCLMDEQTDYDSFRSH
jgi:hypothetical protein